MVQKGSASGVEQLVTEALRVGIPVRTILEKGLIEGISAVSHKFKTNEFYVPQVLMSARALGRGRAILEPYFPEAEIETIGRVVIGTVKGDMHDIGKNLLCMLFRGEGFDVIDPGVDVPPERFVEAAWQHSPDIVGLSALLTTTLASLRDSVAALKSSGTRAAIMVGGAPVTASFARDIGADAYASDAATAVEYGKHLVLKHS